MTLACALMDPHQTICPKPGGELPGGQNLAIDLMRLQGAVRAYVTARHKDFTPASRRNVRETLVTFARGAGPELNLSAIRRRHIEAWIAGQNCQASTIRTRLSVVRTFFRWAVANDLMRRDPTLGVKGPRAAQSLPRELDTEAVEKLYQVLPCERAELIVTLAVIGGLRVSEIAGLQRENIDLTARLMLLRGKGGKERWLPITDDIEHAIRAYTAIVPGQSGPLLRSIPHRHLGISAGYISQLVAHWMRDAGVKAHNFDGRSAHALRHTMAGAMLDEGADIRDVQAALGHANLSATYIYLKRRQANGRLRDSMGKRHYR